MKRWEVGGLYGYSIVELCEISVNRSSDKQLDTYKENGKVRLFSFKEYEKRIPHQIADELNKKYGFA